MDAWIGRSEEALDVAGCGPLDRLSALLDRQPDAGRMQVPPLGHWLYFLPGAARSEISEDGHPKRGGFLPPIALPRRMWAGSRISFQAPIPLGAAIRRVSRIDTINEKVGRSGPMVFVTVTHDIYAEDTLSIIERQDLVYRAPPPTDASPPPELSVPPVETLSYDMERHHELNSVDLFRFSAITFNSHRIHFDRDYAVSKEGYLGLVVHGPFIATLLMDLFVSNFPKANVKGFSFRGESPLFDAMPFYTRLKTTADGALVWAQTADGRVAMRGEIVAA